MKTLAITAIVAAATVAGCTSKTTIVERSATPPTVVYQQPAPPTVVYQQPSTVVTYQQPTVIEGPPQITYSAANQAQYNRAATMATNWCQQRLGESTRAVDIQGSKTGLVTFQCVMG